MQDILFWFRKYLKDFIIFSLILICIGTVVYTNYLKEEEPSNNNDLALNLKEEKKEETEEKNIEKIYVDVKGAVKNPGVYEASVGSIINDVIKMAGGLNSKAYINNINLSKKVNDEMVIYIYTKSEIKSFEEEKETKVTTDECYTSSYTITECEDKKSSIIKVDSNTPNTNESSNKENNNLEDNSNKKDSNSSLVNINTASVKDLTSLSGIGEAKAQKIIQYRESNGNFKDIKELMQVSGIGEKLFEKIKDFITV